MPRPPRLSRASKNGFPRGVFLIELAGCDQATWEWARARGAFPFLDSLLKSQDYRAADYYAGCPWCRPAREAELLYGCQTAVPFGVLGPVDNLVVSDRPLRNNALSFSTRREKRDRSLLRNGFAQGHIRSWNGGWGERLRNRLGAGLGLLNGRPLVYLHHDARPTPELSGADLLGWWARQDRELALLHARALLSQRRHYDTWFLLSPGPAPGGTFPAGYARCVQTAFGDAWRVIDNGASPEPVNDARPLHLQVCDGVAHFYAGKGIGDAEKMRVARIILQTGGGVCAVLWRDSDGLLRWQRDIVAEPALRTPPDATDLVSWLPYLVERDAEALLDNSDAGSWIALRGEPASWLRGGVVILNRRARVGPLRGHWLRPSHIYAAARRMLDRPEHEPLNFRSTNISPAPRGWPATGAGDFFR